VRLDRRNDDGLRRLGRFDLCRDDEHDDQLLDVDVDIDIERDASRRLLERGRLRRGALHRAYSGRLYRVFVHAGRGDDVSGKRRGRML